MKHLSCENNLLKVNYFLVGTSCGDCWKKSGNHREKKREISMPHYSFHDDMVNNIWFVYNVLRKTKKNLNEH